MTKILILYYSRDGAVRSLANEIARGVEGVADAEAVMRTVPGADAGGDVLVAREDLKACDALILGGPAWFGGMATPLKQFFDSTSAEWLSGALKDKPAAVFTSSSSLHGGQEAVLLGMMLPLLHHGMLVLGIPYAGTNLAQTKSGGTPYGASHFADANNNRPLGDDEKKLAQFLGRRVANCAQRLQGQAL